MLDTIRYWLALIMIMMMPGAIVFWYLVHSFIGFWRAVGPPITYTATFSTMAIVAYLVYLLREPLLAVEYGRQPLLWAAAAAVYAIAAIIEVRCRRHLSLRTLVGMPELRPESGGRLLKEGIYGRIRHPRYVSVTLGTLAVALFTNYLAMYVTAALLVPAIYGVAVFEERELRNRFGSEYDAYCQAVPRFIPRFGQGAEVPDRR